MKKPAVLPDSGIFDSLRQGLDAQYQQLNSILDTYNFTSASVRTKQRNRFRIDGDGQLFFEHANPHVFPFAASAVSQAIWRLTKGGLHTPSNGELKVRSELCTYLLGWNQCLCLNVVFCRSVASWATLSMSR